MGNLFLTSLPDTEPKPSLRLKFSVKFYAQSLNRPYSLDQIQKVRSSEYGFTKGYMRKFIFGSPIPIQEVHDIQIPVEEDSIDLRIYQPISQNKGKVIIYFHGGGFTLGNLDFCDQFCRILSSELHYVVVSVGYRLAPENKYPIAIEDAYHALEWVKSNAEEYQGDPTQIIVMGDSAGGNLAAGCAIFARDHNILGVIGQVLIYPWVSGSTEHNSYKLYGKKFGLTAELLEIFKECYLKSDDDQKEPKCFPINYPDLSGLAKAFVVTGMYDPLRDQGYEYAMKLQSAGNEVIFKNYAEGVHESLLLNKMMPNGKLMLSDFLQTLRQIFS
jgi:acetyl esterase